MLSVQTFTIRKHIQSEEGIQKAFKWLNEHGVNAVELARIDFKPDTINYIARAAKEHNIDIGSTQITFDYLENNMSWVADLHHELGCRYASVSVLPLKYITGGPDKLPGFTDRLNDLGEKYREKAISLLYHHHHFEFRKYGERTGWEIITENTDPAKVGLVMDTYWLQRGGHSPQDMISRYAGRVKVVHLRDYKLKWKFFDLLPTDTELGNGNLDFRAILAACTEAGVDYLPIEQDSKKPFDSLQKSISYISGLIPK